MSAFEQLRHTDTGEPIAPDQAFAARLRARIAEALRTVDPHVPLVQLPDRSPTMTTTEHTSLGSVTAAAATATASLVPYVCVSDSVAAIGWYVAVFNAVETVRYVGDDGRIGHAEVSIGSARLMLSDEYPEIGVVGPQTLGGTPFTLNLNVDDVDDVWARAIEHGALGERPPPISRTASGRARSATRPDTVGRCRRRSAVRRPTRSSRRWRATPW